MLLPIKNIFLFLMAFLFGLAVHGQDTDEAMIRKIFDESLAKGQSYQMLDYLCHEIGARLSGSPEAAQAVEWSYKQMEEYGFDTVFRQKVMVPHWVRGEEESWFNSSDGKRNLKVCALGNSVGTGKEGLTGEVVEFKSLEELKNLKKGSLKGKIAFFNLPMDPTLISTFSAYGKAVMPRVNGASLAADYGAMAVIVRSMASNADDFPHTGTLIYDPEIPKIPAAAISTNDANYLSQAIQANPSGKLFLKTTCEMLPDVESHNVIGEIRGSEYPQEIILVGGHLDSWDMGHGAHDDGAGCVQSIEVLRILKALNYQPKRTLRAVMFMNEENGLRGGLEYARVAKDKKELHIAAIESDRGAFTPKGFTSDGLPECRKQIQDWAKFFEPYGIYDFSKPGGGADIGPLKEQGTTLIGFLPDPQRYFNYHHSDADTFDKVDKRELELGAASMTALVYLLDQYGLYAN